MGELDGDTSMGMLKWQSIVYVVCVEWPYLLASIITNVDYLNYIWRYIYLLIYKPIY